MTRFIHDEFAKSYLEELLSPFGEVKPDRKITREVREVDIWFAPTPGSDNPTPALGLLGQLATSPALFEPFRNPASDNEICDCLLKHLDLRAEVLRLAKRRGAPELKPELPHLWILTPTASPAVLENFHAEPDQKKGEQGLYFLGTGLRAALVVIHQLPVTPETLWLRILGRGRVQQQAINELESLPTTTPFRASALELLFNLKVKLEVKSDIETEDRELIMRLSPLYEKRLAEATQLGIEQGIEQGIEKGSQQERRTFIENLLMVRFGQLDPELSGVVESLLCLSSADSTPLLLNLSRNELLQRFTEQR